MEAKWSRAHDRWPWAKPVTWPECCGRAAPPPDERRGQQQMTWIQRAFGGGASHAGLQEGHAGRTRVLAHRITDLGHGEWALDADPRRERTQ